MPPRDQFITAGPGAERPAKSGSCQLFTGLEWVFCLKRLFYRGRSGPQCVSSSRLGSAGRAQQFIPFLLSLPHPTSCRRNAVFRTMSAGENPERLACDQRLLYGWSVRVPLGHRGRSVRVPLEAQRPRQAPAQKGAHRLSDKGTNPTLFRRHVTAEQSRLLLCPRHFCVGLLSDPYRAPWHTLASPGSQGKEVWTDGAVDRTTASDDNGL